MKRKFAYLFVLLISLFVFTPSVYADGRETCNYKLPFVPIDKDGNLIDYSNISNKMFVINYTDRRGGAVGNFFGNIAQTNNYKGFTFYNSTEFGAEDLDCPDYIKVSDSDADKSSSNVLLYYLPTEHINTMTIGDYFNQMKENNYFITLPIYNKGTTSDKKLAVNNSVINKTITKAMSLWNKALSSRSSSMESKCGSKWKNMLNRNAYTSFDGYANSSYSADALEGPDKRNNISEACWNARKELIKYSTAFMDFSKSMNSDSVYKEKISKNSSYVKYYELMSYVVNGKAQTQTEVEKNKKAIATENFKKQLEADRCLAMCTTAVDTDENSISGCKNEKAYKNCSTALTKCKQNNTDSKKIDSCLKNKLKQLGLWKKYNKNMTSLEQTIKKYSINVTNAPTLDVSVGQSYKITCKDVKFLHPIWIAIEIIAPILVIVLGSFDMVRSIISGDEAKITKARNRFPNRLIAGILIFLAFSITSIIVNISRNDNVNDTSIIKCIVNG